MVALFLSPSAVIQYLTAAYAVGAYGNNGTHSIQYIGDTLLANALQQAALLGLTQPLIAANQALFVYPDPTPYNSAYFENGFLQRAGFRPSVFGTFEVMVCALVGFVFFLVAWLTVVCCLVLCCAVLSCLLCCFVLCIV